MSFRLSHEPARGFEGESGRGDRAAGRESGEMVRGGEEAGGAGEDEDLRFNWFRGCEGGEADFCWAAAARSSLAMRPRPRRS